MKTLVWAVMAAVVSVAVLCKDKTTKWECEAECPEGACSHRNGTTEEGFGTFTCVITRPLDPTHLRQGPCNYSYWAGTCPTAYHCDMYKGGVDKKTNCFKLRNYAWWIWTLAALGLTILLGSPVSLLIFFLLFRPNNKMEKDKLETSNEEMGEGKTDMDNK